MAETTELITGRGAFFISPEGELINVSNTSHIRVVINNPERFGLVIEQIRDTYSKYNESMGIEGKARGEIIMDIIKKGWIHIRKTIRTCWVVNAWEINATTTNILSKWANDILKGTMGVRELDKNESVKIFTSNKAYEYTMNQLGKPSVPI